MKKNKFSLTKLQGIMAAFIFGLGIIILSSCEFGPPENSRPVQAQKGRAHFEKYCMSCHGSDAKGITIDSLVTQPKDLTRIMSRRRVTKFPIVKVANIIDGRKRAKIHGTRDMPVWGEVFSEKEYLDESQIKGKLAELIAYLMSIQTHKG